MLVYMGVSLAVVGFVLFLIGLISCINIKVKNNKFFSIMLIGGLVLQVGNLLVQIAYYLAQK